MKQVLHKQLLAARLAPQSQALAMIRQLAHSVGQVQHRLVVTGCQASLQNLLVQGTLRKVKYRPRWFQAQQLFLLASPLRPYLG